jgi:hypothetical protein
MEATQLALLRLYIADPAGTSEYLHDDTLDTLYSQADGSIFGAAAEAWRMKAANVADWYLANIDGSFLSRNQVWEHCMAMADHYGKLSGTGVGIVNIEMDSGFETAAAESEF